MGGEFGLSLIGGSFCRLFKDADVEQAFVCLSAKHIFINASRTSHAFVGLQGAHALGQVFCAVGRVVVGFIESAPLQSAHIALHHRKRAGHPVYH